MTPTATTGLAAGAKATNQASVFCGSAAAPPVKRSSAVPVLPATVTPGICAAVPVPPRTTPIIMSRTWAATFALTARLRSTLSSDTARGLARPPCSPIAAATLALPRGGGRSLFWAVEDEPTAIASGRSLAAGIVLGLATGTRGVSLKPNASARDTSLLAPTLAPSGAKTELQESAKDCARLPPQDSLEALASRTPDSVAPVRTG